MVKIITINSVKGGIGKTTTVANLAAGLARRCKYKVLAIDTDPQANLTTNLYPGTLDKTIQDVFQGTPIKKTIYPSVEAGLDIIPSCLAFSTIEFELSSKFAREMVLKRALEPIKEDYDIILIDTQPSVGIIPINALCAAQHVIIPVHEAYALNAISHMASIFSQVKQSINPDLTMGGILLTMYDPRTTLAKEIKQKLVDTFGALVFETKIPRNVKLAECPSHKQSIFEYAPESTGAQAYEAFTEEIITRGMV